MLVVLLSLHKHDTWVGITMYIGLGKAHIPFLLAGGSSPLVQEKETR